MPTAYESDTLGPLTLDEFPPHSYEDWKLAAEKLLKGAPFEKRLVARTYEGFDLQPIYRREDLEAIAHVGETSDSDQAHRGNYSKQQRILTWKIAQETHWQDPQAFNTGILNDIACGVTESICPIGGTYGLKVDSLEDLQTALAGVDLNSHTLTFEPGGTAVTFADKLFAFLENQAIDQNRFSGSIHIDPLGELAKHGQSPDALSETLDHMASITRQAVKKYPGLQTVVASGRPYSDGGCSASQEIGYTLATSIQYVKEVASRDLDIICFLPHLRISLSIGPHFFIEIAKFRAIRVLWSQILNHLGIDSKTQHLHLHARTGSTNKTIYDSQVNILRTCTEGLAAILGGCDSLTIAPYDELAGAPSNLARRIARNMHSILGEECSFNRVVDPGGGSYYLEHLTDKIAQEGWQVFQSMEAAGGMSQALQEGLPQRTIASLVARKRKDVAIGRTKLVGTNCFPNPNETIDSNGTSRATVPHEVTGAATTIPPYRLADDYEILRRASESLKASRGYAPRILQINYGPSRRYRLRADWTSSFFEVGGFEVLNDTDFADVASVVEAIQESKPDVAILTSDDATYASDGSKVAEQVKQANPELRLFLAGAPGENEAALREAGIDDFIHIRTNNYEALKSLLNAIGALT